MCGQKEQIFFKIKKQDVIDNTYEIVASVVGLLFLTVFGFFFLAGGRHDLKWMIDECSPKYVRNVRR